VYEHPANLFVARFIGSPPMNTLDTTVAANGASGGVDTGAGVLPLDGAAGPLEANRPVVVGVRPEHVHIGNGPLKATVEAIEWLGHERLVMCNLAGARLTVRQGAADPDVAPGTVVAIGADPAHLAVFDPDTGERL
jgi:multiple sugar transport system ATP-binding protein